MKAKKFRTIHPSEVSFLNSDLNRTLVVVPTLGTRASLRRTLDSINAAGGAKIAIVCPDPEMVRIKCAVWGHTDIDFYKDKKAGIHNAICLVIDAQNEGDFDFLGWINDDDELTSDSLNFARSALSLEPSATYIFGDCDYVNPEGERLWTSKFGKLAYLSLRLGPDLIPQPSCLFRFSAVVRHARPDPRFGQAFDFDVVTKLSKAGATLHISRVQSKFGWHKNSETVEFRWRSAVMAARVRRSNAGLLLPIVLLLNPLVVFVTYLGRFVPSSRVLKRISGE